MSDLYDTDVLAWSTRQADLLRRMGAGERVNDQVDFGRRGNRGHGDNVVRSVVSHLVQAILHELKAQAWPQSGFTLEQLLAPDAEETA